MKNDIQKLQKSDKTSFEDNINEEKRYIERFK